MSWSQPAEPPKRSGGVLVLAAVGALVIILGAGIGIGFLVLQFSGSQAANESSASSSPAPTATATVTSQPEPPAPGPTVTVTQSQAWPVGFWSPGSPCLNPYPGIELGLEYGYTNDPTIKSWVLGVQELIQRLVDRGWSPTSPGPIDGEYGAKTELGVLGFQQANRIPQVGRVGATTWATMRDQCERFR